MTIVIKKLAGTFAENKDVARDIRERKIMPALQAEKSIELDFSEVSGATQSFVHALISDAIRQYGDDVFDRITFKHCNAAVREIITTVAEYMQES
jgi:hypothetical protein